jgi:hypothetical protein
VIPVGQDVGVSGPEDVNEEFDHVEDVPLWVKIQRFHDEEESKVDGRQARQGGHGGHRRDREKFPGDLSFKHDLNRTLTEIQAARETRSLEKMMADSGDILVKKAVSRAKIDGLDEEKTKEMVEVVKEVVNEVPVR